jgi:hypothetical protein
MMRVFARRSPGHPVTRLPGTGRLGNRATGQPLGREVAGV